MMQAEAVRGARVARRPAVVRRARLGLRLAAYVVDWLVTVIVASTLISLGGIQLWLATNRGQQDPPNASLYAFLLLAVLALPLWLLVTLGGWSHAGRSVGKLAMGLRIVESRGRPPGLLRALPRLAVYLLENLALVAAPAAIALRLVAGDLLPAWALPLALL